MTGIVDTRIEPRQVFRLRSAARSRNQESEHSAGPTIHWALFTLHVEEPELGRENRYTPCLGPWPTHQRAPPERKQALWELRSRHRADGFEGMNKTTLRSGSGVIRRRRFQGGFMQNDLRNESNTPYCT